MKLLFRLPDEDEEENERDREPAAPAEPMDPRDISRTAIVVAIGGVATQVLWPLPVIYAVLFGLVGAAIGAAALLRLEKEEAALAFLVLVGAMDLFTPSGADVSFFVRSFVVSLGALSCVVAARRWILRALGEDEDDGGGRTGPPL